MEFSIFIKKFIGKGLIVGAVIYSGFPELICAQTRGKVIVTTLNNLTYISAFAPQAENPVTGFPMQDTTYYTILICTMDHAVEDHFFKGNYKIQVIRMGDLYRYIFSQYVSPEKARQDLNRIREIYPQAYIREYNHGKLGLAIDMNIDHIRVNN